MVLHSKLIFKHTELMDISLPQNPPAEVYRYFNSPEARENFLNGNVWFAGPNQLRFCQEDFGGMSDPWEYRNYIGSFANEYALSASLNIIDPNNTIVIFDVEGLISAIRQAIKNPTLHHQVSWLRKEQILPSNFNLVGKMKTDAIKKYQERLQMVPVIANVTEFPTKENEIVSTCISYVGGRQVEYQSKAANLTADDKKQDCVGVYDSLKSVRNAHSQNDVHKDEEEFRFHLNTGSILWSGSKDCLSPLVQYLKLQVPNVSKYCQKYL